MTAQPNHLQDSGAVTREPNALDALASIGEEIARYGAFLLFVAAIAAWWEIAP